MSRELDNVRDHRDGVRERVRRPLGDAAHVHPVEVLLELADADPELHDLVVDIREWIPAIGAIMAPRLQQATGAELPNDQLGHYLDRITELWHDAKRRAAA